MYGFIQKLWDSGIEFILGFWDKLKEYFFDVIYYFYDLFLKICESIVNNISVPDVFRENANYFSHFSSDFYYLFVQLKLPICIAIILAAYFIRFLLNLIPGLFTRV